MATDTNNEGVRSNVARAIVKIAASAAGAAVFSNDETRRALTKLATDTNNEDVRRHAARAIVKIAASAAGKAVFSNDETVHRVKFPLLNRLSPISHQVISKSINVTIPEHVRSFL